MNKFIMWLLRQKPRYKQVDDGRFCGGCSGTKLVHVGRDRWECANTQCPRKMRDFPDNAVAD